MLKNNLSKIMYKDVAKISRAKLIQTDYSDDYTTEYELVYESVPCKLSQSHERSTFHRDDVSQKETLNYILYYSPEYQILENDSVEVRGQKFFAGSEFEYFSHKELQLKRRKEARQ